MVKAILKTGGIVAAVWLVVGVLVKLASPFLALDKIVMLLNTFVLPPSFWIIAIGGIVIPTALLAFMLTQPAKGEKWLWLLLVWAFGYAGCLYLEDVVGPEMICSRLEHEMAPSEKATYEKSPFYKNCHATGRVASSDDSDLRAFSGLTIIALLAAASLQLTVMVILRWRKAAARFSLLSNTCVFGWLLLNCWWVPKAFALLAVAEVSRLIVFGVGLLPMPEMLNVLGRFAPMGLMSLAVVATVAVYAIFCLDLWRRFRAREEA